MQRYQSLLNEICNIVWTSDAEGKVISVQESWQAYTGQTYEQVAGYGWANAIHPDDRKDILAAWQNAIQSGESFKVNARLFNNAAGDYRMASSTAYPIFGHDGGIIEWCGGIIDVNEQAERLHELEKQNATQIERIASDTSKLSQQQQLLETIVANSSIVLIMFDENADYIYVNDAASQMIGLPITSILGQNWQGLKLPAEPMQQMEKQIRQVLAGAKPISDQVWYPTAGKMRLFAYTFTPVLNDDQQVVAVVCTAEDITERDAAEQTIRSSEARLRLLTDALPVLIAYVDHEHRYLYNNPQYEIAFNRPVSEITGKFIWDVIGPKDYQNVLPRVKAALNGKRQEFDMSFVDPNKQEHHMQVMYIPHIEKDQVLGFFALIIEFTELKEAQHIALEQERLLAHMHRVSSLGEMATNIAHELNQPLTAISSYSSVSRRLLEPHLEQLPNAQDITKALQGIEQQSHRAADIVKKIRAFVRKQTIETTRLNINEVVADSIEFASMSLNDHQINLSFEASIDVYDVLGDATQLQQIIINLLLNAAEAMLQQNNKRIIVRTSALKDDMSKIEVIDNGPKITNDQLEQIFEPFHTTKSNGMGMGLAVSHSIAEAHGGRLEAYANQERGVTVSLTLPSCGCSSFGEDSEDNKCK